MWSQKRRQGWEGGGGGGISVASKLVREKLGAGKAVEEVSPGTQLRLQLPICFNLACGSTVQEKTQTCTNVAQARFWKKKSLDVL